MMFLKKYRFFLNANSSPTYSNLFSVLQENGWGYTPYNWWSHFNEKNFDFDLEAAEHLEFKHLLAQLVLEHCPDVMPETYCINDENWPVVLGEIAEKYYMNNHIVSDQIDNLIWILKPSLLNNGQQIRIFERLSQVEKHYIGRNRLGGEHVLQRYLTNPHLLNGSKYSIRMFIVVTNYAGAFLYPYGYYNVANHPYQHDNFTDYSSHLTNEHLYEDQANVTQIPTQNFDQFTILYSKIKSISISVIEALKKSFPQAFLVDKLRTCAIFGFDFMVDADMRVWLIEANHGPCFPISSEHPLQNCLYKDFWQAFATSFVLPIAKKQRIEDIQYQQFEVLKA